MKPITYEQLRQKKSFVLIANPFPLLQNVFPRNLTWIIMEYYDSEIYDIHSPAAVDSWQTGNGTISMSIAENYQISENISVIFKYLFSMHWLIIQDLDSHSSQYSVPWTKAQHLSFRIPKVRFFMHRHPLSLQFITMACNRFQISIHELTCFHIIPLLIGSSRLAFAEHYLVMMEYFWAFYGEKQGLKKMMEYTQIVSRLHFVRSRQLWISIVLAYIYQSIDNLKTFLLEPIHLYQDFAQATDCYLTNPFPSTFVQSKKECCDIWHMLSSNNNPDYEECISLHNRTDSGLQFAYQRCGRRVSLHDLKKIRNELRTDYNDTKSVLFYIY
jgi:hypothetical protein